MSHLVQIRPTFVPTLTPLPVSPSRRRRVTVAPTVTLSRQERGRLAVGSRAIWRHTSCYIPGLYRSSPLCSESYTQYTPLDYSTIATHHCYNGGKVSGCKVSITRSQIVEKQNKYRERQSVFAESVDLPGMYVDLVSDRAIELVKFVFSKYYRSTVNAR